MAATIPSAACGSPISQTGIPIIHREEQPAPAANDSQTKIDDIFTKSLSPLLQSFADSPQAVQSLARFDVIVPLPGNITKWIDDQLQKFSQNPSMVAFLEGQISIPSPDQSGLYRPSEIDEFIKAVDSKIIAYYLEISNLAEHQGMSPQAVSPTIAEEFDKKMRALLEKPLVRMAIEATGIPFPPEKDGHFDSSALGQWLAQLLKLREDFAFSTESFPLKSKFKIWADYIQFKKFWERQRSLSPEQQLQQIAESNFFQEAGALLGVKFTSAKAFEDAADAVYLKGIDVLLGLIPKGKSPTSKTLQTTIREAKSRKGTSKAIERAFELAKIKGHTIASELSTTSVSLNFFGNEGWLFCRDIAYYPRQFTHLLQPNSDLGHLGLHHRIPGCCCEALPGTCVHNRSIKWDGKAVDVISVYDYFEIGKILKHAKYEQDRAAFDRRYAEEKASEEEMNKGFPEESSSDISRKREGSDDLVGPPAKRAKTDPTPEKP
jgi:hypothetical protein